MRTLVLDCQILQTAAYDRGMGKYSLSLLRAIVHENNTNKDFDKIQLLFNRQLSDLKRIRDVQKFLGGLQCVTLDLAVDIAEDTQAKLQFSCHQLTDYFNKNYTKKDDITYVLMAPFFVGFAAVFPELEWVRKVSLVYDIIPFKIWHLQRIFPDDLYAQHFATLMEADHLLTISNAVKDDMISLIGISPDKLTDIDGAAFQGTRSRAVHCGQLKQPYVLMNSAPIVHKNNDRAVRAFEIFNAKNDHRYNLFITSTFDDDTRARLSKLSRNVHFLGNISDEELADAYKRADCLLFPSMAEGLGLPILEAAQWGIPIACSDIPVFSELSSTAFYQFDPLDVSAIAVKLDSAVKRIDWAKHEAAYAAIAKKYTWDRSAKVAMGVFRSVRSVARKRIDTKVVLTIPDPRRNTPAGVIGELLYTRLRQEFSRVYFRVTGSGDKRPSFSVYMQATSLPSGKFVNIIIRDTKKSLLRPFGNREVSLDVNGKIISSYPAQAEPIDRSLNIMTWRLLHKGNVIELDGMVDSIGKAIR